MLTAALHNGSPLEEYIQLGARVNSFTQMTK